MAGHIRHLKIKCPKCHANKEILANEVVEAYTEFRFKDGVCREDLDTANEIGLGIRMEFVCKVCGHTWTGRKGVTVDNYSEIKEE